ncbi:MAG: ureidoglycolate lyase [Proteobacteria bacterium]|nr:ureidoglycolate lyase [Pseudomonadota bacterium]MBI3496145.1 ureidoglycolate lyase [Pseudomonadota bacterium]
MTGQRRIETAPPDYLDPEIPPGIASFALPLVRATEASLAGYGRLVSQPEAQAIEIVRWPAKGWRAIDSDSGDEGGTTEGVFQCWWEGSRLMGRNEAVNGHYVLGFSEPPGAPARSVRAAARRSHVLLWHVNYHPDGGQLFHPLEPGPFVVPLARPGDDIRPEHFKAFWFDGSQGLYIHPEIWHEGVFPTAPTGRFFDKQGRVHARVSCNLAKEFGVLLSVELPTAIP